MNQPRFDSRPRRSATQAASAANVGDPGLGDRQRLAGDVAEREEGRPAARDLLGRPGRGARRVEPQEGVEVVIHDGVAGAVDGEDPDELAEPVLDPGLAVLLAVAAEEGPADAARDAVVPGRDGLVDDHRPRGSHGGAPAGLCDGIHGAYRGRRRCRCGVDESPPDDARAPHFVPGRLYVFLPRNRRCRCGVDESPPDDARAPHFVPGRLYSGYTPWPVILPEGSAGGVLAQHRDGRQELTETQLGAPAMNLLKAMEHVGLMDSSPGRVRPSRRFRRRPKTSRLTHVLSL